MVKKGRAKKKRKLERRLDDEHFPLIGEDINRKPPNEERANIIFSDEK